MRSKKLPLIGFILRWFIPSLNREFLVLFFMGSFDFQRILSLLLYIQLLPRKKTLKLTSLFQIACQTVCFYEQMTSFQFKVWKRQKRELCKFFISHWNNFLMGKYLKIVWTLKSMNICKYFLVIKITFY